MKRKPRPFPRAVRYTLHVKYKLMEMDQNGDMRIVRVVQLHDDDPAYQVWDNLTNKPVRKPIVGYKAAEQLMRTLETTYHAK